MLRKQALYNDMNRCKCSVLLQILGRLLKAALLLDKQRSMHVMHLVVFTTLHDKCDLSIQMSAALVNAPAVVG